MALTDTKTGSKIVYVGKEAQKLISIIAKQTWSQCNEPQDDVFWPLSGFVSRPAKVGAVWHKVRALANIEDVRIHDLRHTFASYAVLEGYPIPMVSHLLGHKRISTTLRYAHVNDVQVTQSVEALGEVICGIISSKLEGKLKHRKEKVSKSEQTKPRTKYSQRPNRTLGQLTDEEVERIRYEVEFWDW